MHRRELLRRGAVAVGAVGGLAGCTTDALQEAEREPPPLRDADVADVSLPVTQRLETAAAAVETVPDLSSLDEFEAWLDEQAIDVEHLEPLEREGVPVRVLEYVVPDPDGQPLMRHLGQVAGGYAALVAASDESEHLEVTVVGPDRGEFGEYEVRRRWAVDYEEGAISARTYVREVTVTLKSV